MGNRKYRLFVLITQNTPTKKENKKRYYTSNLIAIVVFWSYS